MTTAAVTSNGSLFMQGFLPMRPPRSAQHIHLPCTLMIVRPFRTASTHQGEELR